MTITKPNTLQAVTGAAILVTLISTLLSWASVEVAGVSVSAQGTEAGRGKTVLTLAIIALILWVAATLFLQAFPPNVQLPLMGAPVVLAILGLLALLLVVIQFFSGDYDIVDRGFGLFLAVIGTLAWVAAAGIQAKQILDMAKAMKAAQQTPPPAA